MSENNLENIGEIEDKMDDNSIQGLKDEKSESKLEEKVKTALWKAKPRPDEKLRKSIGIGLLALLSILISYAFIRASFTPTVPINNAKPEEPTETKSSYDKTDKNEDSLFGLSTYKKDNSELKESDSSPTVNPKISSYGSIPIINSNTKDEEAEFLEQLIKNDIKEEMLARKSNLTFSNVTENNSHSSQDRANESREGSQDSNRKISYPDDPNYQAQKKEFLNSDENKDNYNKYSEQNAFSLYELKAGAIIPGILLTGINSDLPGTVLAIVREDVYDTVSGNHLLIPKGTKIKGRYDSAVSYGQTRILVVWQRLVFSDGKSINLDRFSGIDMSGYAGLTGKVNNHTYQLFKAVVLSSILGAGTSIISDNKKHDDWESAAGTGAGEQVMEIGGKIADKSLGIQPTIEIPQGDKFNIIVESDLILTPYKGTNYEN